MPWTEELPNGKFKAWWRDDLGKKRSKQSFLQDAAAKRYAGEMEGKSRRGETTTPGRSPKWADWCDEWLMLRQVENSTETSDTGRIDNHIRPKWGRAQIGKITREHVQIWVNEMIKSGMSPGTVARVFYVFSASMKAAMLGGRISTNPCSHVKLPTPGKAPERYFTRAEIDAALEEMTEPYRTAAIILVGSAIRRAGRAALESDQLHHAHHHSGRDLREQAQHHQALSEVKGRPLRRPAALLGHRGPRSAQGGSRHRRRLRNATRHEQASMPLRARSAQQGRPAAG